MNTEELMRPARDMAKGAPGSLSNIMIVGMFVGFLVWTGNRDDVVSTQRIKECHSVQERSISVIEKANEINERRVVADELQTAAFNNFAQVMGEMMKEMRHRDWPMARRPMSMAKHVLVQAE